MGVTRESKQWFYYGLIEDELEELQEEVNEPTNDNEPHLSQRKKKNANKNRGKYGSYGKQHDNVAYGCKRKTGAREARRCENTKHLLSLIEKEDGSEIEMEFETSMSAFAELFMEQEKMKIWNDFVNSSEEEQETILKGRTSYVCSHSEEKDDSWEEIPDLRTAHPAYTATECFERIEKKIKTYLKRRHVPVGMLASMEEDIISFFKDFPTSVYIPHLTNSFERMMLHALCQYLDLSSKSYDDGTCRQTQVENKYKDFLPPTTLLSQYLQRNCS